MALRLARHVDAPFSGRLWDGSVVPLGREVESGVVLSVAGPGVLGSLLRRPTLERLLLAYASGGLELLGADPIHWVELARRIPSGSLRALDRWLLMRQALGLVSARDGGAARARGQAYAGGELGVQRDGRARWDPVQFHYDVGNDFYALFLDAARQYSCAYFERWDASLEDAQRAKLEMICRKLRLAAGDRLLDVGCGWGGLVCHAARYYGVHAHGVTLSAEQHAYAQHEIARMGLADRVRVELRDYSELEGEYDKIASVGMIEHVGSAGLPAYFAKLHSLLRDRGILLNHGITRRARRRRRFGRRRPEQRLIRRYIFPGSELAHIGQLTELAEASGFEVHDVEDWREHYALTTRHWCQRLAARQKEASDLAGAGRARMWLAYLAGVSFAFQDGSLRVYQTVATKHVRKGGSGMPPTRQHLY